MGPGPGAGRRQFVDGLGLTPTLAPSKHKATCPAALSGPMLTPDKLRGGSASLRSRGFCTIWGFLETRDFFGV